MDPYVRVVHAGWAAMDPNAHLRNTAYLDLAVDVRLGFFAEHGFPFAEFQRLGVGPVARRDALEYFREVRYLEAVTVTLALAGLSPDGARIAMVNEFYRGTTVVADALAARVTTHGGWMALATRRLTVPPEGLLAAVRAMPRAADFAELPALRV